MPLDSRTWTQEQRQQGFEMNEPRQQIHSLFSDMAQSSLNGAWWN